MIRSNSKKAIENTRNYVVEKFNGINYGDKFAYIEEAIREDTRRAADGSALPRVDVFSLVAHAINETFYNEILKFDNRYKAGRVNRFEMFAEWCAGLPSILDTCYYYNRSAVDDLAAILEETPEEAAMFTESKAEAKLTALIYREISKATKNY